MTRRLEVAILGIGCRFPGARGYSAFAERLVAGHDAITEVPPERWDAGALYDPDLLEPMRASTRWGGFVEDVDRFDASFFGIGPAEAIAMDPQQRVLLETAWEAFEDANVRPSSVRGARGGVWIAVSHDEYAHRALRSTEGQNAYAATGTELSMSANRLSRWLGWSGPSLALNTGCSSALVALEQAVRALHAGEVDVALVGAVSLLLEPGPTIALSQAWMMAADGRCKAFDEAADGYVRSEGCGVLLLRRGSESVAQRARALVRGVAVGYGSGSSATTPDPNAQADVMRRALVESGVTPGDVTFVEAHGVGTRRGDAAELEALHRVYGPSDVPCLVGSVKTQVGHLEWASGMPAIARAIVALERGVAAPHLHLVRPSPDLRLAGSRFRIPREATPVDARFAAVSSFGLGGTLAHVILERGRQTERPLLHEVAGRDPTDTLDVAAHEGAPPSDRRVEGVASPEQTCASGLDPSDVASTSPRAHVVRVSAADPDALVALARRYAEALRGGTHLADLARTTVESREVLGWVAHVAARDGSDAAAALERVTPRTCVPAPKIAWMFTGQGAQRAGMGRELLALDPGHAGHLGRLSPPLRDALLRDDAEIEPTELAQPALFVFESLLATSLRRYLPAPDAVLGHSVGEYAAAACAGVWSFEDGLRLVSERGRLMGALPTGGGMLAVVSDEASLATHLSRHGLDLAAVNAPDRLVVSGDDDALERLRAELEDAHVASQRLRVSHAFHSAHVAPALDAFEAIARTFELAPATIPIARNLDGQLVRRLDPLVLRAALRGTVRFADGLRTLADAGCSVFLELGPTPTLAPLARRTLGERASCVVSFDPRDPELGLARALATLADLGVPVDLETFEAERGGRPTTLPSYPFRRERFWIDRVEDASPRPADAPTDDVLAGLVGDARRRRVAGLLRAILEGELGRAVDPDRPFFELGLGSLALVRARAEMVVRLGRHAPTVPELFAHPTLHELARFVAGRDEPSGGERGSASSDEPIAIVGVSLRLPGGAVDLATYFDVLARAEPLAREAPERGLRHRACWLDDVASFDAAHFGISPDEAAAMDPQQRWLLEASWHALEDAGRPPATLARTATGVFFGLIADDYGRLVEARRAPSAHGLVGNLASVAAGRVAHVLGLRGPALVVDTACSSSLVAIHLAAQSIRRGESSLALAGGANLILDARGFEALSRSRALAPDGRSKSFSAHADGYGRGEGVVVFVLSSLRDALERGDRIHGLLLGSGIGHDGRAVGLTAPSGDAQRALVSAVHTQAGVLPEEVDFVECHGTGTPLGDPIEIDALARVLGGVPRREPLRVGAAKAVIGHGEAVAGASGVAKVLACLAAEAIPPQPLPGGPHPSLALTQLGAEVPTTVRPWRRGRPRVAAVSAFGMSGTNAHAIVSDAAAFGVGGEAEEKLGRFRKPPYRTARSERSERRLVGGGPSGLHAPWGRVWRQTLGEADSTREASEGWLALSASSDDALRALARAHLARLSEDLPSFADYAAASRTRRSPLSHRLVVLAASASEASQALSAWLEGRPDGRVVVDGDGSTRAHAWLRGERSEEPVALHADLPLTPFVRTTHWLDPEASVEPSDGASAVGDEVGGMASSTESLVVTRELVVSTPRSPRRWRRLDRSAWRDDDHFVASTDARTTDADEVLVYVPDEAIEVAVARLAALARFSAQASPTIPFAVVVPDVATDVRASALAAALRVIRYEHPELEAALLRVAPDVCTDDALARWSHHRLPLDVAIGPDRFEREVVDHTRLRPVEREVRADEVVELVATQPGFLDEVRLVARSRPTRSTGEVRIRVDSVALSFLDAMRATGMLDDSQPGPLGVEVLGVVLQADGLPRGAPCVALAPEGAASEVVLPRAFVHTTPHAATLHGHVLSELVATEVFERLAPWIGPEHRVLVQSATGAIGRALVHRARERGAVVYGTAGDDLRRQRAEREGVVRALPSRLDAWRDEVLALTDGEGVDLVLSSTAGDGVAAALEVVREGGTVIDLDRRAGRRDPPRRDNRTLVHLDVLTLARRRPERVRAALEALAARGERGQLPPTPRHETPVRDASRVLRSMAQAQHDGKLVLRFDAIERAQPDAWRANPEGTYVITGGLGALGLATARWLADRGARRLWLVSRRGPDEAVTTALDRLRASGVEVVVASRDVTDPAQVRALLEDAGRAGPIVGLVHAAGVLDDGLVEAQTADRIARVLAPKLAADLLDALAPPGLELFVLYGSVAGSLGNPGQIAYAAGNAALAAIAARRRARGEHALCVDWGPFAEMGMAASLVDTHTAYGARPLEERDAFERLERALLRDARHTIELDADLAKLARVLPTLRARLSDRVLPPDRPRVDAWTVELRELPEERRRARVADAFVELASGLHLGELGLDTSLALDSLAAVELRERVRARLGIALPAAAFLRGTPRQLADAALSALGFGDVPESVGRAVVPLRRVSSPRARLLCLPFAGGDPRVFRDWPARVATDLDVLAVELPGRGARHAERPYTRMSDVVAELVEAVLPELDRPLVIFGHCMGALVGYELTRALADRGRVVHHLLASACPGPRGYAVPALCHATRRYDRMPENASSGFEPVHAHDDVALAEVLRFLGFGPTRHLLADAGLRAALLPTIRADFEVCGTYEHRHEGPLATPITALCGDQDPFASPEEVARWREVAGRGLTLQKLEGDHYFLFPRADEVVAAVRTACSRLDDSPADRATGYASPR